MAVVRPETPPPVVVAEDGDRMPHDRAVVVRAQQAGRAAGRREQREIFTSDQCPLDVGSMAPLMLTFSRTRE